MAKKKMNVVKTAGGTKHVPVGKRKYRIHYLCNGRSCTKECTSSTMLGAKRKCGVTKDCKGVRVLVLRVGTGKWESVG